MTKRRKNQPKPQGNAQWLLRRRHAHKATPKEFQGLEGHRPIRLAPLTVIFGANSAGKSSLGHLLLALKQTAQSTDRKRALHLGDASTLIDLGTFGDCMHGHDQASSLRRRAGPTR